MGNVLISFLGTGNKDRSYRSARYKMDDFEYETTFISDYLIRKIRPDKLFLFGTAKSMWEEVYQRFSTESGSFSEETLGRLIDFAASGSHQSPIQEPEVFAELEYCHPFELMICPRLIRYGLNEAELQENIAKILDIVSQIDAQDEVHIDVTHAFRSIPIFGVLLVAYLKQFKGNKQIQVYYGMLDVTNELGYTPVVTLQALIHLLDWILAVNAFNSYGATNKLSALMTANALPDKLVETAKRWAYAEQLNDNESLIDASRKFISHLETAFQQDVPAVFKVLKPNLQSFPHAFANEPIEWKRLLMLARKNLSNDRIGLCLINTWEALISRFEGIMKIKVTDDRKYYEKLSSLLRGAKIHASISAGINKIDPDFFSRNKRLHAMRNNVAHGNKSPVPYPKLESEVERLIREYEKVLPRWEWEALADNERIQKFLSSP